MLEEQEEGVGVAKAEEEENSCEARTRGVGRGVIGPAGILVGSQVKGAGKGALARSFQLLCVRTLRTGRRSWETI